MVELAIALYSQGILSLGKARELASMSKTNLGYYWENGTSPITTAKKNGRTIWRMHVVSNTLPLLGLAAIEQGITTIVMDERDGRSRAKALGLSPVGVIGVLLRAKRTAELKSVSEALQALRNSVGFFISEAFQEEILKETGER